MNNTTFDLKIDQCVACAACTISCMDQNDIDVKAGEPLLRKMYSIELPIRDGTYEFSYLTVACMHCGECSVMDLCPSGCFTRDEETRMVVLDRTDCIGCGRCVAECTFKAISFDNTKGKAVKCNGCMERVKEGLEPACVRACPTKALTLGEPQDANENDMLSEHLEYVDYVEKFSF